MQGLSPRNLKYMRAFAAAWPERAILQEALAQIPWYHHIALLEKLDDPTERLWYARQAMEHGWSHNILVLQIDGRAHDRHGKAMERSVPFPKVPGSKKADWRSANRLNYAPGVCSVE